MAKLHIRRLSAVDTSLIMSICINFLKAVLPLSPLKIFDTILPHFCFLSFELTLNAFIFDLFLKEMGQWTFGWSLLLIAFSSRILDFVLLLPTSCISWVIFEVVKSVVSSTIIPSKVQIIWKASSTLFIS